jgi:hypothetical protein
LYARYAKKLEHTTNPISKRYAEYFQWVVDHLNVNHDYTFIPVIALDKWNKYYPQLVKNGWIETEYGLLKANEEPKPLYTFSS